MAAIIKVNGVNQTIAKINKFAERKIVKLDKIMDSSLKTMSSQANVNAPGDIKVVRSKPTIGNMIFSSLETALGGFILISRSFFVVSRRMTGGWITGTRAI